MKRRAFLTNAVVVLATEPAFRSQRLRRLANGEAQGANNSDLIEESQSGDPDLPKETLRFDLSSVLRLFRRGLFPRKDNRAVALQMLATANSYVGLNRHDNPDKISQFLDLFGLNLKYSNEQFTPYCAAGISFCACQAYCNVSVAKAIDRANPNKTFKEVVATINKFYFAPSAACRTVMTDSISRGTWVAHRDVVLNEVQPGWLVLYNWNGGVQPQHIGIVEQSDSDSLHTVEFNTSSQEGNSSLRANINGGAVAKKVRPMKYVLGVVKTY